MASPGPIGGTTPAAITGTTVTGNTSLLSNLIDARTATTLSIAPTTATAINVGKSGVLTTVVGDLQVNTSSILYAQGGATYIQVSNGGLDLHAYNTPITVSAYDTLTLESRNAGASLDAAGNVTIGGNTGTAVNIGRSAGTIAVNATATWAANKGITFAAGSGSYDAGSASGGTTFGTGHFQWNGANNKFVVLAATGASGTIYVGAAAPITITSDNEIRLQSSGANRLYVNSAVTLAANVNLTATAGTSALNFGSATGDTTLGTGSVSWTGASGKALSLTSLSAAIALTASGSTATITGGSTVTLNGSGGGVVFQRGGSAVLDVGVASSTTVRMLGGVYLIAAAGAGGINLGSATGDTTFGTGTVSWTGATNADFLITAAGASGLITLNAAGAALTLTAGAASTWSTTSGALTINAASTLNLGGSSNGVNITGSGAGGISIGTNVSTDVTIINNSNFKAFGGTTIFDFSAASGIFKTSTGANTLSGDTTVASGKVLTLDSGTATGSGLAVTLNKQRGIVTTEALTTNAGVSETYTITNSLVTTASAIFCQGMGGTNTVPFEIQRAVPGTGSFTVKIFNSDNGSTALNGTVVFSFLIL